MCATSAAYSSGLPSRAGCGTCCAQGRPRLLGQPGQERGVEQPRRDGHDPDLPLGQVPGDRQGHPDDPALGRRVGGLADLALVRGDRRGVDDDPALLVDRLGRGDPLGRQPDHVERADEVDVDDLDERVERERRAVAAEQPAGGADAGAVDHHPQRAELAGRVERRAHRGLVGHVARRRTPRPRRGCAAASSPLEDGRSSRTTLAPALTSRRAVARPEPGRAAGHQRDAAVDVHADLLGRAAPPYRPGSEPLDRPSRWPCRRPRTWSAARSGRRRRAGGVPAWSAAGRRTRRAGGRARSRRRAG